MNNYNLEIKEVLKTIKDNKAKKVCLQFADGLKPNSKEIYDLIREEIPDCNLYLWGGTCFGACDTPIVLNNYKFDLVIQFGHSEWKF